MQGTPGFCRAECGAIKKAVRRVADGRTERELETPTFTYSSTHDLHNVTIQKESEANCCSLRW